MNTKSGAFHISRALYFVLVIVLASACGNLFGSDSNGATGNGDGGDTSGAGEQEEVVVGDVAFTMVYVPGVEFPMGVDDSETAVVEQAFWIGETAVTYALWDAVYQWATEGSGDTGAGEYSIADAGRMGSDGAGEAGMSEEHPVTMVSWRSAMVWSNALTEFYNAHSGGEELRPVYYSDVGFTTPIRTATSDPVTDYPNPGSQDDPYVDEQAEGFRLPLSKEWELAARYIVDADNSGSITNAAAREHYPGNFASGADAGYDEIASEDYDGDGVISSTADVAVYNAESTAAVKSKRSNALGLYDISGNVWERMFDFAGDYRVLRGGSWNDDESEMQVLQVGYEYGYFPYIGYSYVGFRVVKGRQ